MPIGRWRRLYVRSLLGWRATGSPAFGFHHPGGADKMPGAGTHDNWQYPKFPDFLLVTSGNPPPPAMVRFPGNSCDIRITLGQILNKSLLKAAAGHFA